MACPAGAFYILEFILLLSLLFLFCFFLLPFAALAFTVGTVALAVGIAGLFAIGIACAVDAALVGF